MNFDINAIAPVLLNYASILLGVMFLLVFTVNVIVEVVKRLVPVVPTDLVVFIVSIAVTMLALWICASVLRRRRIGIGYFCCLCCHVRLRQIQRAV